MVGKVALVPFLVLRQAVGVQQQDVAAAHQRPFVHLVAIGETENRLRGVSVDAREGIKPRGGNETHRVGPTSMNRSRSLEKTAGNGCAAERKRKRESSEISP